jgi:hypothetical protein
MLSETSAPVPVRIAVSGVRQRGSRAPLTVLTNRPGGSLATRCALSAIQTSLDDDRRVNLQMRVGA